MKTPAGIVRSLDTLENAARKQGADAERASIVALVQRRLGEITAQDTASVGARYVLRGLLNTIERGDHAQPEEDKS